MRNLFVLLFAPLLALAACGGDGNSSTPVTSATAVATVKPPAGTDWLNVVQKTPEGGYMQGNPNAPIKLVEYGSRSCPVCGAFANTGVEPLRTRYVATGRVSYEFRDFMIHPQDPGIALLGHCVPTESFFAVLDRMYALQPQFNEKASQVTDAMYRQIQAMPRQQQASTWAEILGYIDLMKQSGVPEAKARACLADTALLTQLSDIMKKGADDGVSGTPTFFINGKQVPNVVSFDGLEPALMAAGAR